MHRNNPGEQIDSLANLLGPERRLEVQRIAKRLLIAGVIAAGPIYLLAVRAEGIKEIAGVVVLMAILFGLPAYFIVVAGPTVWRERVVAAGLPAACRAEGFDQLEQEPSSASGPLAVADGLGLLPDYNTIDVAIGLTGTLDGVPIQLFDLTLVRTGGTGRRLVFKGLLISFDLPSTTRITAAVHPTPGLTRRALRWLGTIVGNRQTESVAQDDVYTVRSDDAERANTWITSAVLTAMADLGRAQGRHLDRTTFASIVSGLLTRDMPAKAVTGGLQDGNFYLAIDRRAALVRVPNPITAPRSPSPLLRQWERQITQVLEPVREMRTTNLFHA